MCIKPRSELDALLAGQRDEHFEGGHEGGDLCEAGPGDHAGVEGDGAGVVGALQVRAEPVQRVQRRLRQLERREGNLVIEIDDREMCDFGMQSSDCIPKWEMSY